MTQIKIPITKSAREFGYLIWNSNSNKQIEKMLAGKEKVNVHLNGFDLGEKNVDRKYHRISLGFKFTRALPDDQNTYVVYERNGVLEVKTVHGDE